MANTQITVTIDTLTKRITAQTGVMSIRETVELTIIGGTVADYSGYRLWITHPSSDSTLASCNAFTEDGDGYATGTLNLNTTELIAFFSGYRGRGQIRFFMSMYDITNDNYVLLDGVMILNCEYQVGMDEPTAADYIGGVPVEGVTNGDTHDHYGGDGGQIDHIRLANIGTLTHAQIDAHLAKSANGTYLIAGSVVLADESDSKHYELFSDGGVLSLREVTVT